MSRGSDSGAPSPEYRAHCCPVPVGRATETVSHGLLIMRVLITGSYSHIPVSHNHREASLRQEMKEQSAEHEQLQMDFLTTVRVRDQVLSERTDLQRSLQEQRSTISSLTDQLARYKAIEQRLFDEKQSYQSKLEAIMEEKSKLAKVC